MNLSPASLIAFLLVFKGSIVPAFGQLFVPADDQRFAFTGRWKKEGGVARADWPCSGFKFNIFADKDAPFTVITLRLNLHRVRASVVVQNAANGIVESSTILEGGGVYDYARNYDIKLDNINQGTYTVYVKKLTQASPYNNGLGKSLRSVIEFHGVSIDPDIHTLGTVQRPSRRVSLIGASDTSGFCVDGTPETNDALLMPWKYDNCDMTSHSVLGRRLDAEVSVQAIAGIGLTQNAYADKPFLLGRDTMPDYYDRVLQTEKEPLFDFDVWRPDLVVVSLGGNDFNHQKTTPSNETFQSAYEEFLGKIADPYLVPVADTPPTIVSICGEGDPTEHARDPNNDRCRACPNVEDATRAFQKKHSDKIRVEYIFIPCDGSVVTGQDDIGCEGHKNRLGQKRVADFLEPRLRKIMGWQPDLRRGKKRISRSSRRLQA